MEELEVLKIRSVQGHGGDLLSDEMDLNEIHRNIYVLADGWRPTLGSRPPVKTQGYLHPNFDAMHCHGVPRDQDAQLWSVAQCGLFPGGLSADGSPGRVFVSPPSRNGCARTTWAPGKPPTLNSSSRPRLACCKQPTGCPTNTSFMPTTEARESLSGATVVMNTFGRGLSRPRTPSSPRVTFAQCSMIDEEAVRSCPQQILFDGRLYSDNNERFLKRASSAAQHVIRHREPYQLRRELQKPELPMGSYLVRGDRCNKAGKEIYVANWGVGIYAWPARLRQGLEPKQRTEQRLWAVNELVIIPRPVCEECRKTNVDGMIHCVHCGNRLESQGDLANALSTFKEKAAATREGRPSDFVKMSPNYDTNRIRSQIREGDFLDVNSAGSTLRQRCHQVKKKSLSNNDEQISDLMHKRPFEAFNYAAKPW